MIFAAMGALLMIFNNTDAFTLAGIRSPAKLTRQAPRRTAGQLLFHKPWHMMSRSFYSKANFALAAHLPFRRAILCHYLLHTMRNAHEKCHFTAAYGPAWR